MRYPIITSLLLLTFFHSANSARGQENNLEGPGYIRLDTDRELALARSAAPNTVSEHATIWVLSEGEYQISIDGSNGNHCLVMRSYPKSLEPICYNRAGSESIMLIELHRFALRNRGLSWAEIDLSVEDKIAQGILKAPSSPALAYMMSSAQDLYAPNGAHVGPWQPHLMFYLGGTTAKEMGLSEAYHPHVQMFKGGTSLAQFIVVVPEFVDPQDE